MKQKLLVHEFLENCAKQFPDKIALICGSERLTYKAINKAADQLASDLIARNIQYQDRVVIFLDNSIESIISLFGILKAGCVFVIVNGSMKAKKLGYILSNADTKVLITHLNRKQIIHDAVSDAHTLEHIIWCHTATIENDQLCPDLGARKYTSTFWFSIFQNHDSSKPVRCPSSSNLDIATIIYTSGSTGFPKGVISAHYNMVAAIRSITSYLNNHEDEIILCVLPLSFDYGLYQVLMCFYFGGTLILEKSFSFPFKILQLLQAEKVTGFPIVPTMVPIMGQVKTFTNADLPHLRYITNTSSPLHGSHISSLRSFFPNAQIYSMYGLTECKRVSYLPPEFIDTKPDSVGIPMPGLNVKIVDSQGEEVKEGETGELVITGPSVMQGYWKLPEETATVFRKVNPTGETSLFSGDLFRKDEDGYLYFISRKDDLLKVKGERVSPKEVENALMEIKGVLEAAIIGTTDDTSGTTLLAFVVKHHTCVLSEKEFIKECMNELEATMIPRHVFFVDSLPKTENGKIDKKYLASQSAPNQTRNTNADIREYN